MTIYFAYLRLQLHESTALSNGLNRISYVGWKVSGFSLQNVEDKEGKTGKEGKDGMEIKKAVYVFLEEKKKK